MDLIREKVFVNRYHYDVRNHEWEKENGVPKTNVEVTFQLHNKDEEANNTSVVAVLQFMIVRDEFGYLRDCFSNGPYSKPYRQ